MSQFLMMMKTTVDDLATTILDDDLVNYVINDLQPSYKSFFTALSMSQSSVTFVMNLTCCFSLRKISKGLKIHPCLKPSIILKSMGKIRPKRTRHPPLLFLLRFHRPPPTTPSCKSFALININSQVPPLFLHHPLSFKIARQLYYKMCHFARACWEQHNFALTPAYDKMSHLFICSTDDHFVVSWCLDSSAMHHMTFSTFPFV